MALEKDLLFGDVKIPPKKLMKRLWKYIRPVLWPLIFSFTLLIINVIIDIILPLFISNFISNIAGKNIALNVIITTAILYLVMGLINQLVLYIESMNLQRAGQKVIYSMRNEIYEHVLAMSIDQFNAMPVGSIVTRVVNYTSNISDLFTTVIVNLMRNILTIVGVFVIMVTLSPMLSLILLGFAAVVLVASLIFSKIVHKIFKRERQYISDLNSYLNENLSGMRIIQIFNQEAKKEKEFLVKNERLRKAKYQVTLAFGFYRPFITLCSTFAIAVVFSFGVGIGLAVYEISSFYYYIYKFFNPIENLSDQLNQITRALTACERIFNFLDVEPEVKDKEGAKEIDHFEGKIEFRNVWFAYEEENWILKDVSFTIEPKQTVAFVGATGAGKTTILGLIVRNYEIQKGQILIDDVDIKDIKITSLRRAIGQMLQDVFLFSGTIRSNITLGDDTFSEEEIKHTCDYVNASYFIDKLDKGLDEEVIEKGENFSAGQRQLLSFARTVLHKPQILILDEATANIDTETEVLIQESLQKIKNIGTMLMVAHRLSTIQHADNIIVLSKGEIIESGNHQELLKKRGQYYKLYQLQFEEK